MAPKVLRRAISAETAATLTEIMEAVVERGTAAKVAQIEGYTVAGKTGTASKLVNRRYSKSDYNASFVGFVPSRKPALTIVVVIDSPHTNGYYGATVSAPVFRRIAEAALRHLGIGPTVNAPPPVLVARHDPQSDGMTAQPVRAPAMRPRRGFDARRGDAGSPRAERPRSAAHADAHRLDGADQRRRLRDRTVAAAGRPGGPRRRLRADARHGVRPCPAGGTP